MTNKEADFAQSSCITYSHPKKSHVLQIDRNVPITFSRTWRISDSERMGSRWFVKITFLIERTLVTSD